MFDYFLIEFPVAGITSFWPFPPLVSFSISFFTATGGISGAFLLLPFQMDILGFTSPSVSSTNFLFNIIGTPGGIYRFFKEKRMAWPLALILFIGIIPGILLGYFLRLRFFADLQSFKLFAGLVLLLLGIKLAWDLRTDIGLRKEKQKEICGAIENWDIKWNRIKFDFMGNSYSFKTIPAFISAACVGVIGGVYGIGGGAYLAPLCITFFALPVYAIAGAILFVTFASSVVGLLFYSFIPIAGETAPPDMMLGALLGFGGMVGIYLGARVQKYIPEKWIKLLLMITILLIALKYIINYFVLEENSG